MIIQKIFILRNSQPARNNSLSKAWWHEMHLMSARLETWEKGMWPSALKPRILEGIPDENENFYKGPNSEKILYTWKLISLESTMNHSLWERKDEFSNKSVCSLSSLPDLIQNPNQNCHCVPKLHSSLRSKRNGRKR